MPQATNGKPTFDAVHRAILRTALKQFLTHGIRPVTMDNLAADLGISKRTIYEHFGDKQSLLVECLHALLTSVHRLDEATASHSDNRLDMILKIHQRRMNLMRLINPRFYTDLMRYSRIMQMFRSNRAHMARQVADYMQDGVADGLFRDDIDYQLLYYTLAEQISSCVAEFVGSPQTLDRAIRQTVTVSLRGICTQRGLQTMDRCIARSKPEFDPSALQALTDQI